MGSPPNEPERSDAEGPHHRVTIGYRFAIGRYAVTFVEYDHFCEETNREKPVDQGWGRDRQPVINVSWRDAKAYVEWLSRETGQACRLPSEAEWECACRAGTTTPFSFGETVTPSQVNYDGNYAYTGGAKGVCRNVRSRWAAFPRAPGIARDAREYVGMGRGHLARKLFGRAGGRQDLDRWRKKTIPSPSAARLGLGREPASGCGNPGSTRRSPPPSPSRNRIPCPPHPRASRFPLPRGEREDSARAPSPARGEGKILPTQPPHPPAYAAPSPARGEGKMWRAPSPRRGRGSG